MQKDVNPSPGHGPAPDPVVTDLDRVCGAIRAVDLASGDPLGSFGDPLNEFVNHEIDRCAVLLRTLGVDDGFVHVFCRRAARLSCITATAAREIVWSTILRDGNDRAK